MASVITLMSVCPVPKELNIQMYLTFFPLSMKSINYFQLDEKYVNIEIAF
jgi:hypothetical protein